MVSSQVFFSGSVSSWLFHSRQTVRAITLSFLTSRPDVIEGGGCFGPMVRGHLGDLSDSIAQIDLDADLIALGDLLVLQDIGIGHW
jgi:hypothetical protein